MPHSETQTAIGFARNDSLIVYDCDSRAGLRWNFCCLLGYVRHPAVDRSRQCRGGTAAAHGADQQTAERQEIARTRGSGMGVLGIYGENRIRIAVCPNSSTGVHQSVRTPQSEQFETVYFYLWSIMHTVWGCAVWGRDNAAPFPAASCPGLDRLRSPPLRSRGQTGHHCRRQAIGPTHGRPKHSRPPFSRDGIPLPPFRNL